jgi:hypothetical protein
MNIESLKAELKNINSNFVLLVALSFVWISRLINFVAFPLATETPDSLDSLPSSLFDFKLVSFIGNAPRPWVTNLFYAIIPGQVITLAQLFISGLSATILLFSLNRLFTNERSRKVGLVAVAAITSSALYLSWDNLVNLQSLTNSFVLLFISTLINVWLKPNFANMFKLLFCQVILCTQRPFFLFLFTFIYIFISKRILNGNQSGKKAFIYLLSGWLILSSYTILHTSNQNNFWPGKVSGISTLGYLKESSPVSNEFRDYLKKTDIPQCLLDHDRKALFKESPLYCEDGLNWTLKNAQHEYVKFLLGSPKSMMKIVSYGFFGMNIESSSHYGNAVSILPRTIENLLVGERNPNNLTYFENSKDVKFFLYLPTVSIFLINLLLMFKRRREQGFDLDTAFLFLNVGFLTLLGVIINCFAIYTEWSRIFYPNQILIQISLIISLAILFGRSKKMSERLS